MQTFRRLLPALVLLGLATLSVPVRAAETDRYLPNNTEGVVTINVKQMLESPIVKNNLDTLKAMLGTAGDTQKVLDDLGFDPFRDVNRVVLAIGQDASKPLVLVHGKFDTVKVVTKAEQAAKDHPDALKITKVDGHTIYQVTPPDKDDVLFVALLDSTMVAASPNKDLVLEALDKQAGKKQSALNKDLQTMLSKADTQQSISIVTLGGPLAASGQPLAAKISNLTGGITLTDEVKAEVVLNTKNVQDAKSVEAELDKNLDTLKALADVLANQKEELKPLVDVVNTLKLSAAGNAVTLKGQLTKDMINKLMARKK